MTTIEAPGDVLLREVREVAPFERIELRDPANRVDMILEPGARLVAVEGPAETVRRVRTEVRDGVLEIGLDGTLAERVRDALTTSLTRRLLVYRICVPRLYEVRVAGLVSVSVSAFGADAPAVTRLHPQAPFPPVAPAPPR